MGRDGYKESLRSKSQTCRLCQNAVAAHGATGGLGSAGSGEPQPVSTHGGAGNAELNF